ncbi:MAG: peroxiredoxin [Planctomycetota bacterium]|nr:peroxiredoxin [Planctomycetota bacterium]
MLTVGDKFPEFSADACIGSNADNLTKIDNQSYDGKWVVYFFYPKDFTFICPTEISEFNNQLGEFQDRDAMVVGGSTDNEYSHLAWCQQHEDLKDLQYPLIGAQKLAFDLGIIDPSANVCTRSTFVVDPHGVIQFVAANSLSVGRNIGEILRVLDAIQSDELCPCNWKKGEATLS